MAYTELNDITKYVTVDNIVYLLKKLKSVDGGFIASDNYVGGFKTGFVDANTRRGVKLNESQQAYVELWPDPDHKEGNVGTSNRPIYFEHAVPKEITITSGTANDEKPLLVNDDNHIYDTNEITANYEKRTITAPGGFNGKLVTKDAEGNYVGVNVGKDTANAVQPVYFKDGKPTAPTNNVGSGTKPIYMNKGVFTPSQSTVGSPTKPVYLKAGELTACNDIVYTTNIKNQAGEPDPNLTTPADVGGIKKGTPLVDQTIDGKVKPGLNGKSFSELFDDLLFPTVAPTYTKPSASISWKSKFQTVYEVGSPITLTVSTGNDTSIKTSFSKGAITLNGVRQNDRSGNLSSGFVYVNGDANNKTLPTTVPLGDTTFKYRASYEAGPQPLNNKGGKVDADGNALTALPAGSVDSGAITLNGTYPWYAPTSKIGTWTKQPLISWKDTAMESDRAGVTLQGHSDNATPANKQGFKFPRPTDRNTTIKIEVYNTSAYVWEDVTDSFTIGTDETINGITYKFYYASMTTTINARKFRVTF